MKNLKMVKVRLVPDYKLYCEKEIKSSQDAVKLLQSELESIDREVFCAMNLNSKGNIINASIISVGELTSTLVHPREVFKASILSNAAAVILMHTHPSGDPLPSRGDIDTTKRLEFAGKLIGIRVLDHIIIGHDGKSFSMRAAGHMENTGKVDYEGLAAEYKEYESIEKSRIKTKGQER